MAERLETLNYDGLMRVLRGDVRMTLLHVLDLLRLLEHDLVLLSSATRPAPPRVEPCLAECSAGAATAKCAP
jgi:hypothetical protein